MAWEDYLKMSTKQRRNLARKANRGDKAALSSLKQYTRDIKTEVNKRLKSLEKANLNYGKAYNNVMFFTQTQYDKNRLLSPTGLKNDPYDMQLQNEIGIKFLKSDLSTVRGSRDVEQKRLNSLKEKGALPNNISNKKAKEFLRFLGNEEISAAIDEYGDSEIVVEMMYDAYKNGGTSALSALKVSMTEFLSERITFDEAMERVGVKVEDYFRGRPTT